MREDRLGSLIIQSQKGNTGAYRALLSQVDQTLHHQFKHEAGYYQEYRGEVLKAVHQYLPTYQSLCHSKEWLEEVIDHVLARLGYDQKILLSPRPSAA